jgi:hypothetical protein
LELDPKKRPTCVELLNHIFTEETTRVTTSQSMRVSFTPLDNIEVKSKIFEKRDSLRGKLDFVPTIAIESVRKDDILKTPTNENKFRHTSNYEPKKYVFEKKPPLEVKPSVYYTKIKSEKSTFMAEPRPPIRQKSQLFEP